MVGKIKKALSFLFFILGIVLFYTINTPAQFTLYPAFGRIAVAGQSTVIATGNPAILTLIAGTNITITTNAAARSITINSTGGGGGGITSINGDSTAAQTFIVGSTGTDFNIEDNTLGLHTIHLPTASSTVTGKLDSGDWLIFNNKLDPDGSAALLTSFPTLNQNTTGSAGTLSPGRTINTVLFDGSANIVVTADANTLTNTILKSTVVTSSLTSVGILDGGSITSNFGSINIGADAITAGAASFTTGNFSSTLAWGGGATISSSSNVDLLDAVNTHTAVGLHTWTSGANSAQRIIVTNTTNGGSASAGITLNANTNNGLITSYSPAFTTSGLAIADSFKIDTIGSAGLNLVASHATGSVRIYTNSILAATFNSSQALALVGNLDINTNKFNVVASSGNTLIAGTLGVSGTLTGIAGNFSSTVTSSVTTAIAGFVAKNTGEAQITIASDIDSNDADTDAFLRFTVNGDPGTLKGLMGYDEGLDRFILGYNGTSGIRIDTSGNFEIPVNLSRYKTVATAGWGVPAIYGSNRQTAKTAAIGSTTLYTVGAADGSFEVSANVRPTTATTHAFTVVVTYTDEGNTARTATLSFTNVAGTAIVTSIANAAGAVPYQGIPIHIRCKAATAIAYNTVGTFTTVTYNIEAIVKQLS